MNKHVTLFFIIGALCVADFAASADVNYAVSLHRKSTQAEVTRIKDAFPVSSQVSVDTFYYVSLNVTGVIKEPETAAAGQATTSVSMLSDDAAVIAYEVAGITDYKEESVKQSALQATGLTSARVTLTVTSVFIIRGVVKYSDSLSIGEIRASMSTDLSVPIGNVTVSNEAAVAARRSLLADKFYNVAVTTDDFAKATDAKDQITAKMKEDSAAIIIVAKVKTRFMSKTTDSMKAIFTEKLASMTSGELTQKVNVQLTESGSWT